MYTLRDHTKTAEDFENTLRRVAEIGIEILQLTPPAFLGTEATAKLLAKYKLRADSVFAPTGSIVDKVDGIKRDAELLGCDVVRTGREYPELLIRGGFDKRILAKGPEAIDAEIDRIMPVMKKRGGYIPTCDHGVPEEVSFENYLHYRKRMLEYAK